MVLVYESSPGYYYVVDSEPKVTRITKKEFNTVRDKYNYHKDSIKVGDLVTIIVKPYKQGKYVTGKIKKILTKKKVHTRGHKVLLQDGTIGRMICKGERKKN